MTGTCFFMASILVFILFAEHLCRASLIMHAQRANYQELIFIPHADLSTLMLMVLSCRGSVNLHRMVKHALFSRNVPTSCGQYFINLVEPISMTFTSHPPWKYGLLALTISMMNLKIRVYQDQKAP